MKGDNWPGMNRPTRSAEHKKLVYFATIVTFLSIARCMLYLARYIVSTRHPGMTFGRDNGSLNGLEGITPLGSDEIDWDTVSRGQIAWYKCPEYNQTEFDCGYLLAPLDYTNANDPRNATIAFVRYKAGGGKTPRDKVIGSLLVNPGGPGGSGVDMVAEVSRTTNISGGASTDTVLDHRYDIIGFDPRGVGLTRPNITCFDHQSEDVVYNLLQHAYGFPGSHANVTLDSELGTVIGQAAIMSDMCFAHHPENAENFKFISSPFVARDMNLLHKALGDAKLNYWGFSYGTVLGRVYATLFPDEVERLVIDGVVDLDNYFAGLWSTNLLNTEAEYEHFYDECFEAGPSACKLGSLASNAKELQAIVTSWIDALRARPIPALHADPPQLLTFSMMYELIFRAMYSPRSWQQLSDWLYEGIAEGNVTALATDSKVSMDHPGKIGDVHWAIACGDVITPEPTEEWTLDEYRDHLETIEEDSAHFGRFFAVRAPLCLGSWRARGAERFEAALAVTTSFPILSIGNDFDPVTPALYADGVSATFNNSVSIRRAGYGHCSTSQTSSCVEDILKRYFVDGEVPESGTFCKTDEDKPLFSAPSAAFSMATSRTDHMENLADALKGQWKHL